MRCRLCGTAYLSHKEVYMRFLGENRLRDLLGLVKEETDKKLDKSLLQEGNSGEFLVSDGNGGIEFIEIPIAEGSAF